MLTLLLLGAAKASGVEAEPASSVPQTERSERIVITATQRPVPALEVPASVSVFTADRLAGAHVTTVKQMISLTPAMGVINSIGESFGQLIAVRGIATSGADIGLESTVGITVDGVPISRPNLATFDLHGIDRIEFLRGPQGTLFGTNTTAGLINILTSRPVFIPFFEASGTLGERERREVRVSGGGGVAPNLAVRVDALVGDGEGYLDNPNTRHTYGGRSRQEVRGQLLWDPHPDVDVRLIADYFHHGGTVNSAVYRVVGPTGAVITALSGVPLLASPDATDLAQVDNRVPRREVSDSAGLSAQANWRPGTAQFTAIASYRSSEARRSYDVDNSPADIANDPRDGERFNLGTLELRFRDVRGPFDYLFGAYFSRGLIVSRDSYTVGADFEPYVNAMAGGTIPAITGLALGRNFPAGSGVFDVFRQRSNSLAFFTHHVIALSNALALSLGGRYTHEDKSLAASITTDNPGCASALARRGGSLTGVPVALQGLICIPNLDPRFDGNYATDRNEANWSGTAALTDSLSQSLTAYVNYSRGYKGGGYQFDRSGMHVASPSLSQVAFGQETTDSFEGGIRQLSPDGVWRASAALFHMNFHDYQFSYFTGLNRRTRNVPKLVSKGVEAETAVRIFEPLEVSFSGIYQEAIFGESGFPTALTQLQGTTAPLAPRWILIGAASYQRAYQNWGVIGFGDIDVRWQSKANVGASAFPSANFLQKDYAVIDARLGMEARDQRWRVELWARNLFDERAWSILNNTTLQPGSISGYVSEPRSVGVTAAVAW